MDQAGLDGGQPEDGDEEGLNESSICLIETNV